MALSMVYWDFTTLNIHIMERKALTVLFFTLVLDMIGIGMIIPIVPIIFTDPTSSSFLLEGISQKYWYTTGHPN